MTQDVAATTGGRASLLRGINVGGHHQIPMARLRRLYERLGFEDVQSYIQSGNVTYRSPIDGPDRSAEVEAAITAEFGWAIRVLERTHADLARLMADDPFPTADPAHRHVMFLFGPLSDDVVREYATVVAGDDEARLVGTEMHLLCPDRPRPDAPVQDPHGPSPRVSRRPRGTCAPSLRLVDLTG